jgi:hypothetical protein
MHCHFGDFITCFVHTLVGGSIQATHPRRRIEMEARMESFHQRSVWLLLCGTLQDAVSTTLLSSMTSLSQRSIKASGELLMLSTIAATSSLNCLKTGQLSNLFPLGLRKRVMLASLFVLGLLMDSWFGLRSQLLKIVRWPQVWPKEILL